MRDSTGNLPLLLCVAVLASGAVAQAAPAAFQAGENGRFAFDTGLLKGHLHADAGSEQISSLVDVRTGKELTQSAHKLGLLRYYRLLSKDNRWGDVGCAQPKTATLRPDGSVQVDWPAGKDIPIRMGGTFRWAGADTLDLEVTLEPERDIPGLELFIGSYFGDAFRGRAYVAPTIHAPGKPEFVSVDATPLILGTYLAFPRDLPSARMFFDGRWDKGSNPVHWSVMRYMGAPLAMQQDASTGLACLVMSRPRDCFAVEMPYNKDPADGVSGHHSTYVSLFGWDATAGRRLTAIVRLVVARDVTPERALEIYGRFLKEAAADASTQTP